MADEKKPSGSSKIQIVTGDEMSRGRYSNNMVVLHSPEERTKHAEIAFRVDLTPCSSYATHTQGNTIKRERRSL